MSAGNLGTPEGDVAKYLTLSNGEFDFQQVQTAIDHQSDGWLQPATRPILAQDLADGFDTRYLSFTVPVYRRDLAILDYMHAQGGSCAGIAPGDRIVSGNASAPLKGCPHDGVSE